MTMTGGRLDVGRLPFRHPRRREGQMASLNV